MVTSLNVGMVGPWRKTRIFLVLSLAISISSGFIPLKPAFADTFPDSGFESGDFTGWNIGSQTGTQTTTSISQSGKGVNVVSGNQTFSTPSRPAYGIQTVNGAPNPYYAPAVPITTWTFGPYGNHMGFLQPGSSSGTFDLATTAIGLTSTDNQAIKTTLTEQKTLFDTANNGGGTGANPTNAAWITRSVTLTAGTVYTMSWNYIGTDYVPFNDGSITTLVYQGNGATPTITINNSIGNYALLGFTNPGTGDYSTGTYGSTGWQQSTYQVSLTGDYLLGFAVFNLGDTELSPVLLIDSDPGLTTKNGVQFGGVASNNPNAPPPPSPTPTASPSPTVTPAPIPAYRIDWATNTGIGYMNPQYAYFGTTVVLERNLYKKDGYTFAGWNTKADGTGVAYADGASFKIDSTDVILYAQWKLIQTKPSITWQTPIAIQEGTPLSATQLNALAGVAGTYTYLPASTTMLPVGKHTLKVTFVPTEAKYETVETTVEIEVLAKAKITWANPAAIVEGTALSATQLNALGSVPGTYSYAPTAGAIPPVGKNILKVTFTPTDTRLSAVTAEATIEVTAVIPAAPISPTYTVTGNPKSTITWGAGTNAATYTVSVDGKSACSDAVLTCEVAKLLGPKSVVTVTSVAAAGRTSAAVPATYVAPDSPQVLTVVTFDSARAVLKKTETAKLRAFASQIKAAGFNSLTVFGHTDSVGGVDNKKLSVSRANSTITYLKKLLPGVKFVVSGFAAGEPVADNSTAEGKAANRRAEVFIP